MYFVQLKYVSSIDFFCYDNRVYIKTQLKNWLFQTRVSIKIENTAFKEDT